MASNRALTRLSPALSRGSSVNVIARRALPRSALNSVPSIGLLFYSRYYSSNLSTSSTSASSSSGGAFPPPGFDPKKAGQPLPPVIKVSDAAAKKAVSDAVVQESKHVSAPLLNRPTAESKTVPDGAVELVEKLNTDKKVAEKADEPKLTLWQKVKKEFAHYRDGTKLLAMEVKISSRLALKMAAGYELTRREHRQLQRTVKDLGRLVPFSMFVIVPFAELLLPVALKLFPNMLPSTYEGQKDKEKKAANLRATRNEVSNFLRQTLKESGLPVTAANAKKEEFTEFFRKVRSTGENPTPDDVIRVCQIFKDDITLDNLSRPQLVGICRYMNLNAVGPDTILRYQIRHRMRQIKRDDRAISFEGVESLSVPEIQMATAQRGLPTLGLSPARLRDDLQTWLDLRLKYGVPSTLLVLANAFVYAKGQQGSEIRSLIGALQDVLSSIPEELFHEIELEVHNAEGAATNRQRLEVLKEQQELIEEENAQHAVEGDGAAKSQGATVRDHEDIDDEKDEPVTAAGSPEEQQTVEAKEVPVSEKESATPSGQSSLSSDKKE